MTWISELVQKFRIARNNAAYWEGRTDLLKVEGGVAYHRMREISAASLMAARAALDSALQQRREVRRIGTKVLLHPPERRRKLGT